MVFLFDLTLAELVTRLIAGVLWAGVQGGLLALLLRAFGAPMAAQEGRLTLNPFVHLTLSGVFLAVIFRASWIAPMPMMPKAGPEGGLWPRLRPLAAVLASFGLLLALIPLLDLARGPLHELLGRGAGYLALNVIEALQYLLLGSVLLGLFPLPGLLLGQTLPALYPPCAKRFRKLAGVGQALAVIVLVLGWFPDLRPLLGLLQLV